MTLWYFLIFSGTSCFTTNNSWSTSSLLQPRSTAHWQRRRHQEEKGVAWKQVTRCLIKDTSDTNQHKPTWTSHTREVRYVTEPPFTTNYEQGLSRVGRQTVSESCKKEKKKNARNPGSDISRALKEQCVLAQKRLRKKFVKKETCSRRRELIQGRFSWSQMLFVTSVLLHAHTAAYFQTYRC